VFLPLHDDNRLRHIRFQYVTLALIALNVMCFTAGSSGLSNAVIASFAIVPTEMLSVRIFNGHANPSGDVIPVPEALTLLTYMFFHGDILHIAGNMLFLWIFGDNVEDACGHLRFLALYLAAGIFGGLVHVAMQGTSVAPLIGASGAVAGVIAAYLMLHPRVMVWVLAFKFLPLRIPAFWVLGGWIGLQFLMLFVKQTGPIAWWAHVGGILAGAALIVILRRPGVPLFDGVGTVSSREPNA
jgi:membrane associated rhomboid family serine protease